MMKQRFSIPSYLRTPLARWGRTFLIATAVGILSGLAAAGLEFLLDYGFHHLIGHFTHVSGPRIFNFNLGILLLPAAGGLLGGVIVAWVFPNEKEHGTNQMIAAFHQRSGMLPLPSPTIKALAAVGVISCGGSAGPEGPIAALGAGIGSSIARALSLSARDRRIMLIAGCAGGIGAIFRCPLGGALFAASVLYEEPEFEAESIVPSLVASVLSYSTFMAFWGYGAHLIEGAETLAFTSAAQLIPYFLLGIICGLLGIFLYFCLSIVEKRPLRRMGLPRWLAAGLGGLLVGVIGCALPQVMDARYEFLQHAMDDSLRTMAGGIGRSWGHWAAIFGVIAIAKCMASALTVGTVGAGGMIGPTVFIGGAAGAFLGALLEVVYPGAFPEHLRKSLLVVGMAGVLAATMRTPMAAIVMLTEMTGTYGLIVPLMLVSVTAYVIGRRYGLNSAQVRSAADSPAHAGDPLIHMLQAWRVRDLAVLNWPYVARPETSLGEMVSAIRPGTRPVFAVLEKGELVGIVSLTDIRRVIAEPGISDLVIASDLMTTSLELIAADQDIYEALDVFRSTTHDVIPVVPQRGGLRYVGMLPRQAIYDAIRVRSEETRRLIAREHAVITTLEQDEHIHQLMMGMPAPRPDTVQRMAVPSEAVGQSLRSCDFRRRYGAQVIAVQSHDGRLQCPPDIDAPLPPDTTLLVIVGSPN